MCETPSSLCTAIKMSFLGGRSGGVERLDRDKWTGLPMVVVVVVTSAQNKPTPLFSPPPPPPSAASFGLSREEKNDRRRRGWTESGVGGRGLMTEKEGKFSLLLLLLLLQFERVGAGCERRNVGTNS